jgi:16S rRNA A1518/A1519 N6-dimethyltransferase RsmA/KsgA/DIM1 with predicted DNA glycosylase/AP lyase activity
MYCEIYKEKNCEGCPEYNKDFCEGVKKFNKECARKKREDKHARRNYTTYKQIQKYVTVSNTPDLTSTEIVDKITSNDKRIVTNTFYVNEVMQRMYKCKKIKGKNYYFAKFK